MVICAINIDISKNTMTHEEFKEKHEEFQRKVEAIPDQELAEMARKALSKLCSTGGQSFTMTVPPRVDDTDIILLEVIKRFEVLAFVIA